MSGFKPEYRNFCRSCGRDFSSVKNFDKHRIGKHEYDFDWRDETKQDGRRCLNEDELREIGLVPNTKGRWHDPEDVESAARRLRGRVRDDEAVPNDAVAA